MGHHAAAKGGCFGAAVVHIDSFSVFPEEISPSISQYLSVQVTALC